jgi:hypothetical protein
MILQSAVANILHSLIILLLIGALAMVRFPSSWGFYLYAIIKDDVNLRATKNIARTCVPLT